jgi:hypothetical protein
VKQKDTMTTRTILGFGVGPTTFLRKDGDGSIPLHIAVQNTGTALVEVLLRYGPTEQLYTENMVGQTPLDIASLKFLPRVIGSVSVPVLNVPHVNVANQVDILKTTPPFDVEKQKEEIPKLRSTLGLLLADGRLVNGTKLATELLAFASCMEEKLAAEMAKKDAAKKDVEKDEFDHQASPDTPASTYVLLRDAVAARPGGRQLVHLADVQQSVQRSLTQQADGFVNRSYLPVIWGNEGEELKKADPDPEAQRIMELRRRSLFNFQPTNQTAGLVNLMGLGGLGTCQVPQFALPLIRYRASANPNFWNTPAC